MACKRIIKNAMICLIKIKGVYCDEEFTTQHYAYFSDVKYLSSFIGDTDDSFATEVTQYTMNTEVKVDGQPITADKKITTGRVLEATNSLTFPDSQQINAGDTLTFGPSKRIGTCY